MSSALIAPGNGIIRLVPLAHCGIDAPCQQMPDRFRCQKYSTSSMKENNTLLSLELHKSLFSKFQNFDLKLKETSPYVNQRIKTVKIIIKLEDVFQTVPIRNL